MKITAQQVKELRERTGAGMMDCKKALEENNGDLELAITYLREKGIAQAAKKVSRIAAEGLCSGVIANNLAYLYEVNSETDFVARNEKFIQLVAEIGEALIENKPTSTEEALKAIYNGQTIDQILVEATATIGEKLNLRRVIKVVKKDNEEFGLYIHMGGKIVSLVVVEGTPEVAKDLAMHVAAFKPIYLARENVEQDYLVKEKSILLNQALEENKEAIKPKPENIIEKIVEGRLNKQLEEICLLDQSFVKDGDIKVKQYLKQENGKISVFNRLEVGEGIEKREEDFAAEVSGQIKL